MLRMVEGGVVTYFLYTAIYQVPGNSFQEISTRATRGYISDQVHLSKSSSQTQVYLVHLGPKKGTRQEPCGLPSLRVHRN